MNRSLFIVWAVVLAVGLTGCPRRFTEPDPYASLGSAAEIVTTSVRQIGGLEAWRKVNYVSAAAVVTTYGQDGKVRVNRQQQRIYLHEERIVAQAQTGEGSWRADVRANGRCRVRAKGFAMDQPTHDRICDQLALLLRRVFGPLDLLDRPQRILHVAEVRAEGEDLVRVGLVGRDGDELSYYLAVVDGELRFVADGGRAEGVVTTYEYMMLPNGLAFPQRIRVVVAGENVLVGDRPIFEVRYTDVEIY